MSSGPDLTSAFGRPARDLAERLGRNPRRARRDDADDATTRDSVPPPHRRAPEPTDTRTSGPAEVDEAPERHLTAAPEALAASAPAAGDPHGLEVSSVPGGGGGAGPTTSTRERPAPPRTRRASAGSRGSSRTATATELDPTTSYQVPVYVHPGVRTAATTLRKTEKLTNAEVAFNAIDEVQHRLAGLIRDRRLQARPDSSLFPGRVRRGRLSGGGAAAAVSEARRVLWGFRATGAELEVIDRLVSDSGAESRSELVAVALEETLLR